MCHFVMGPEGMPAKNLLTGSHCYCQSAWMVQRGLAFWRVWGICHKFWKKKVTGTFYCNQWSSISWGYSTLVWRYACPSCKQLFQGVMYGNCFINMHTSVLQEALYKSPSHDCVQVMGISGHVAFMSYSSQCTFFSKMLIVCNLNTLFNYRLVWHQGMN